MKKIKTALSAVIILIMMLGVCISTPCVAAETKGLDFSNLNYYETPQASTVALPSTYEATVCLSGISGRAGVIIGTYTGKKVPIFNFEVHTNGAPRIYVNSNTSPVVTYDVCFNEVNLLTGVPTHVAVTVDHTSGTWSCYVDGSLKQTIKTPAPAPYNLLTKMRLGGDFREGNTQYFKGVVSKVALYSNIRSADQIASDAKATAFDRDKLICAYDLSSNDLGNYPSTINSASSAATLMQYHNDWIKEIPEPEDYAYSFAVIGDIQTLTHGYSKELSGMYDWIRKNAESKKIKYVIGLGDITETNRTEEYELVNDVYAKIDGVVPFSIIRGNHDRFNLSSSSYDRLITQEKYGDEITGSYDKTMKNTYRILEVGSVKYLFMNLDYLLKDEVLEWANGVISENRDCHVIVSTHIYMNSLGKYYTLEGKEGIGAVYGCKNNGQGLWDKLIKKHENIVMVLCGHCPTDNIFYRQKTGENKNKVFEILIDPQTTDKNYAGTGLIAMFYFSEDGRKLEVQYYSTAKDAYFKSNNQFKLTLDIPDGKVGNEEQTTAAEQTSSQTAEPHPTDTLKVEENGGCNGTVSVQTFVVTAVLLASICFTKKYSERKIARADRRRLSRR